MTMATNQLLEWDYPPSLGRNYSTSTWQAKTGLASPLVKAVNGEQQCFGSDEKTEQDWFAGFR